MSSRKVIAALAKVHGSDEKASAGNWQNHVPFRESKLTCLMQHAISGNSFTIMLACLSPNNDFAGESLSTLHYASLAAKLKTAPVKNQDPKLLLIVEDTMY